MNKNELLQVNGNLMMAFLIAEETFNERIGSSDMATFEDKDIEGFIARSTNEEIKRLLQAELTRRKKK